MTKTKVKRLIKWANNKIENDEDIIYVNIMGLDYVLSSVKMYEGIDPNNKPFQLMLCFVIFNDEHNSRECDILIDPNDFEDFVNKGVVKESGNKRFIFNVTFAITPKEGEYIASHAVKTETGYTYTNPLTVVTTSYKEAVIQLEKIKTSEWVSYKLEDVL